QTSPANNAGIKITVTNGGKLTNENFTDTVPAAAGGSVSGSVKSAAGAALFGVTVYLDANNNSKLDTGELTATTNAAGAFSFTKVPARGYTLRQILLSGDTQKTPTSNAGLAITVTNGGNLTGKNFTDNLPAGATISGTVKNNKGAAIASAVVYLDANNNSKLDPTEHSAITNSSGAYSFANIPAGTYNIRQKAVPAGDTQTTPANGAAIHITPTKTSKLTNENFVDTIPATGPTELTGKLIGSTNALTHAKSGHPASNAVDNKTSTTFEGAMANGNWIGLDLGKAFSIKQIKFAADPANPSFMEGGVFQAANKADFSDEVNLYQVPNTSTPSTSLKTVTVSNTKTFRYVRYLPPANSFGEVAEIEFFG
ncbi:MAG TPA: carboxypeptidase-like regulatory domain-containing protein, partial [Tepidisphaeraceae bacterium]|nr:carboxypeptidase-like regulatory domain-containing protein [Tepidisphaeraceae bacterium]